MTHRVLVVVGVATVGLLATALKAQTRPDFSGKWTRVVETITSTPDGGPAHTPTYGQVAFGQEFTATQDGKTLTIDWAFMRPMGRGASEQLVLQPAHSVFNFDGSETNALTLGVVGGNSSRRFSKASWEANKLVILWMSSPSYLPGPFKRQTLWLDADGSLVVETATNLQDAPSSSTPPTTTRSVYRKTPLELFPGD